MEQWVSIIFARVRWRCTFFPFIIIASRFDAWSANWFNTYARRTNRLSLTNQTQLRRFLHSIFGFSVHMGSICVKKKDTCSLRHVCCRHRCCHLLLCIFQFIFIVGDLFNLKGSHQPSQPSVCPLAVRKFFGRWTSAWMICMNALIFEIFPLTVINGIEHTKRDQKKTNQNYCKTVKRQWLNVVEDTEIQLFEFHTTKYDHFAHTVPLRFVHVCCFCGNLLTFSIWLQFVRHTNFEGFFLFGKWIWMSVADALFRCCFIWCVWNGSLSRMSAKMWTYRYIFFFDCISKDFTKIRRLNVQFGFVYVCVCVFVALIWFLIDKIHNKI